VKTKEGKSKSWKTKLKEERGQNADTTIVSTKAGTNNNSHKIKRMPCSFDDASTKLE